MNAADFDHFARTIKRREGLLRFCALVPRASSLAIRIAGAFEVENDAPLWEADAIIVADPGIAALAAGAARQEVDKIELELAAAGIEFTPGDGPGTSRPL